MNFDFESMDILNNIIRSMELSAEKIKKQQNLKNGVDVPVHQALEFVQWSSTEAVKRSHIRTYQESGFGNLVACFEFNPVRNLFWTGLRASWTRNVPIKYRITALSLDTDMKYTLYDLKEIPKAEWVFLPSVIPAFDMDNYKLFLEFEIPKETANKTDECFLTVRMAGFEGLIEIGDKQCVLVSNKGPYNIALFEAEDADFASMFMPVCEQLPKIQPNCTVLPQAQAQAQAGARAGAGAGLNI